MDSKTINKLIRSEIWPLLREAGFTRFEARNAYANRGPFINVVNFQSFNSYLAGGLGCTTFSFAVNLGVYIIGQQGEYGLPRDKAGQLAPREYHCAFRSQLRKRTPVDGFARDDIFFIDPDGRTAASCFEELRQLAERTIPEWFEERNSIDRLIAGMSADSNSSKVALNCAGRPGSYIWNSVETLLMLLRYEQSPRKEFAAAATECLDRTIGTILDFSTIQSGRPEEEKYALDVRELWDHFGGFAPKSNCDQLSPNRRGGLEDPVWAIALASQSAAEPSERLDKETVIARRDLWPILRRVGFSEFTDRLAHRVSHDLVEVVEILPMDPYERKTRSHPPDLFRIGLGLFWNDLREEGLYRKDRKGNSRPIADECHISNWLTPCASIAPYARTAFDSAQDVSAALAGEGLEWLELFRNSSLALPILLRADWELFLCFPMMRGYGSKMSPRRLTYIAQLSRMLGESGDADRYQEAAEAAIDTWYAEHLRPRYRSWIVGIHERLAEK